MFESKQANSPPPYQGPQTLRSPLLDEALNRYKMELNDGKDFVLEVDGVEELLDQTRALETGLARKSGPSTTIGRLEPVFSQLNNFAAVMALCFGTNVETTALVWGSIRLILTLASPAQDVLSDVLDMLEEISWSLPRFTYYEKTLPMDESFKSSLVAAYGEMTLFCARTINFFRNNPHYRLLRKGWPQLANDFQRTMKRLKRLSQVVETEAEAARMRLAGDKHNEVLSLMKAFQESSIKKDILPLYHIPLGVDGRFFGRDDEFQKIIETLDPEKGALGSRSLALYGMGGVGKTTMALRYANSARDQYDAILWISADNMINMTQDFLDVAVKLGLVPQDRKSEDAKTAMTKVKEWLNETSCRWLVIFDNADDIEILSAAWPGMATGSILLTSRDFTSGFSPAGAGLAIKPFDDTTGSIAFMSLTGQSDNSQANRDLAREITHKLGGLPLALRQISGFVVKQRIPLGDFLGLYERNAAKIHTKKIGFSDYQHTLSTVWSLALSQLTGHATSLQKLLAFFDPNRIDEEILTTRDDSAEMNDEFSFLNDEMDFLDAKEVLLRAALVDRSEDSSCLSVHRLVQATVIDGLTTDEREIYLAQAIRLLARVFPSLFRTGPGHMFTAWNICAMCLSHVHFLVFLVAKYKIRLRDQLMFAELLSSCAWYLFESERNHEGLPLAKLALENIQEKYSLEYAYSLNTLGSLWLDTNRPKKALECFGSALRIREGLLPRTDGWVAASLNSISLVYTELRDFEQAAAYQQKAMDIRLETNSPRIVNSYSNMSSILLGLGKADEAEEMLLRCPSLKDMTDECFLRADNPRLSSDMVLLSRIRVQQGQLKEALRLRSKALAFRQKTFGDKYKTCDSLYQIADLLHSRGDSKPAIGFLKNSITFLQNLPEADGFLARANFKLSQIHDQLGYGAAEHYKEAANHHRARTYTDLDIGEEYSEESFNLLTPWMMW
ncbi:MAG: hypothetical protein M1837_000289 [Sclerophora amabilis]|nr:MAG: hypothetical protein M1837_000289 [Sclerophora amabilis]